jgi:hypothetical protein
MSSGIACREVLHFRNQNAEGERLMALKQIPQILRAELSE